jgi:hypothetical protein
MTKTILLLGAVCCVGCGQTTSPRAAHHVAITKTTSAPEPRPPQARVSRFEQARDPAPSDEERDRQVMRELRSAHDQYAEFVRRAGSEPAFAEAVSRSRERMADIRQTLDFMEQGLAERRH